MDILKYEFKNNIPVFKCSYCGQCSGTLESTSLLNTKNRGCCWYFPKYTLIDIKNILNLKQKDFIKQLLTKYNTILSQYYIQVQGIFDEISYKNYLQSNDNSDFDSKLFFKLCPFFNNNGCGVDFYLRPHPCNLYLCRNVIKFCHDDYKLYHKERKDYYAYCNYCNEYLKQVLMENKTNLLVDFNKTLFLLDNTEISSFENRTLNPLHFTNFIDDVI